MRNLDKLSDAVRLMTQKATVPSSNELCGVICRAGLYSDGREVYGAFNQYMGRKEDPGVWQHPYELASFMHLCLRLGVESIVEVGSFFGFTSVLLSEFLFTYGSLKRYTTVDLHDRIGEAIEHKLFGKLQYLPNADSSHIRDEYDLCLIDGDHTYDAARTDYYRLVDRCKYAAFHDIRDHFCAVEDVTKKGGVPTLWKQLKKTRPAVEIIRTDSEPYMGIGVLL